ncbi:GNAT family N-acetyltransferase [Planosporangium sp. 12N6]|uniref:GNAT family N-acetyltransferase n=1 Tax=Planosporangium spinosum TaxID=3402278 RepID=UPI003CF36DE0
MVVVRQANPEDCAELIRLRAIMLSSVSGQEPAPGPWLEMTARTLRTRLADPDGSLAGFVVDAPGRPGTLAACVLGSIELRLGSPENPSGEMGYVFSVATDPDHRRRGYSRACMEQLLAWFQRRGITKIDLRASAAGEPLYRSLGFARTRDPAMRLTLPRPGA